MARKLFLNISPYILGVFFSLITILLILNATLFNFKHHNESFYNHDLHSYIENIILDAKTEILNLISNNLSKNEKQILSSTLDATLTSENIRSHIDITLYELLLYIRDDNQNPPKIYIENILPDTLEPTIAKAIPSTISSTTLLSYFNKDEIIFSSLALKFFYFSGNVTFFFSISIILLLLSLLFIFNQSTKIFFKKIFTSFFMCSFINVILILIFTLFIRQSVSLFITPASIGYFFIPDILSVYFKNLINTIATYLIISTIFTISFAIFSKFMSTKIQKPYTVHKHKLFSFLLIVLFLVATILKTESISNKNLENNYSNTFRNLILRTTSETVIPAGDDAAYNILLSVVNTKDITNPVADIQFEISGLSNNKDSINIRGRTNKEGQFSHSIYPGSYRITFDEKSLDENFLMPRPYYFNIENPGTFVLSISLTKKQEPILNSGHLEIIVLGKENIPLENIQFKLQKSKGLKNDEILYSKEFSVSNNKGIAIFKSNIGEYEVLIVENSLPKEYQLKKPFNVEIQENTISTYTIKLVPKSQ